MNTNILATATALSDQDLLTRLRALAGKKRETSVELVAHLAALDARPSVFAAQGYGSLHAYCTQALHLSEDAASNRIAAARARRRFAEILDLLASGEMTLTSVRLLGRHLTPENHRAVLEAAKGRTLTQVEKKKLGVTARPRSCPPIRRETDNEDIRTPPPPLRDVPRAVKRAVWKRDGGQCAFVSVDGRRCTEREFLEFHHVQAYAKQGSAAVDNISLRCRRHNQYEAELIFGPHGTSIVREDASLSR